jgi:hypothetical protein
MSPLILALGAAALVIALTLAAHFIRSADRQRDALRAARNRPPPPPIVRQRTVYFVRGVQDWQRITLNRQGQTLKPFNLGELRHQLFPPPPVEAASVTASPTDSESDAPATGETPIHSESLTEDQTVSSNDDNSNAAPEPAPPEPPAFIPDPLEDGLLLEQDELNHVLQKWHRNIAATIDTGLATPELRYCEVVLYDNRPPADASAFQITCGKRLADLDRLRGITANLLAAPLQASVEVSFASGPIADDGIFRVVIDSSAARGPTVEAPPSVWGLSIEARQAFSPSGLGTAILAPDGYALAELVGMNLFIHHALFQHSDFEPAIGLYTRILQELQPHIALPKLLERVAVFELGEQVDTIAVADHKTIFQGQVRQDEKRKVQSYCTLTDKLLTPKLGRDVLIRHGGGTTDNTTPNETKPDGDFHIVLWSSPLGNIIEPAPTRLFGLPVAHYDAAFLPSGRGEAIVDKDGFIAAELFKDALYVHFDLMRTGSLNEARTYARLLTAVLETQKVSGLEGNQLDQANRDRYADVCLGVSTPLASPGLHCDVEALTRVQSDMHNLLLQAGQEEQGLYQLEAAPESQLAEEFDRLLEVANVLDVKVSERMLTVSTDVLFCRNPGTGRLHEIGAFDIQIPTEGGEITWINRTRKVDGYQQHMNGPHIFADGRACLGNVKDLFPQLIAKRDFASAVQVAIAFVEAVNINDAAGKHIGSWPLAQS